MCGSCWDAARSTSHGALRGRCAGSTPPTTYVGNCDHDLLFHTKGQKASTGSMRDVGRSCRRRISSATARRTLSIWARDGIQDEDAISSAVIGLRSVAQAQGYFGAQPIHGGNPMEAEILGNIPACIPPLADWLTCLFICSSCPSVQQAGGGYTILRCFCCRSASLCRQRGRCRNSGFCPCIAVSILIMYLYIRMQTDVPARCAGGIIVSARLFWGTGRLAGMAALLLYGRQHGTPGAGVRVCILAVVYAAVYGVVFAQERNYNDIASPLHVP